MLAKGEALGKGRTGNVELTNVNSSSFTFFFLRLIDLFYFWLCWVFVDTHGPSSAAENGASSLVVVHGVLISGSSCCRAWALGMWASVILARRL